MSAEAQVREVLEALGFQVRWETLTGDGSTVLHGDNPNIAVDVYHSGDVVVIHRQGDIKHYHEGSVEDLADLKYTVARVLLQELGTTPEFALKVFPPA